MNQNLIQAILDGDDASKRSLTRPGEKLLVLSKGNSILSRSLFNGLENHSPSDNNHPIIPNQLPPCF